ncbi:hypothetical protein IJD34_03365 [bacterium]|nr:hypothetical protein [bacterium]
MGSIYDKYKNDVENLTLNKNKMIEFYGLMRKMQQLDYDGRVALMKEMWGEPKVLPATHYYGEYCNVVVFKENDKYKFTFNCDNGDFKDLQKAFPELAAEFKRLADERLKTKHPELFEQQSNADSELFEVNKDSVYLNLYNNIKINRANPPEKKDKSDN